MLQKIITIFFDKIILISLLWACTGQLFLQRRLLHSGCIQQAVVLRKVFIQVCRYHSWSSYLCQFFIHNLPWGMLVSHSPFQFWHFSRQGFINAMTWRLMLTMPRLSLEAVIFNTRNAPRKSPTSAATPAWRLDISSYHCDLPKL